MKLIILLIIAFNISNVQSIQASTCKTAFACLTCSADPKVCEVCNYQIMMVLSAGQCVRYSQDANCRKLDNNYKCSKCKKEYFLNAEGVCTPVAKVSGCILYGNQSANPGCNFCGSGFVKNGPALCTDLIPNCANYATNLVTCVDCKTGFTLSSDKKKCVTNGTVIANCDTYDSNQKCSKCITNYILFQEKCYLQISNCKAVIQSTTDASAIKCSTCNAGFYLKDGGCLSQSVTNCKTYNDNTNVCTVCLANFYASQEACLSQNIENCLTYTDNTNNCVACKD